MMNAPKLTDLTGPQFSEKYFKFHYPEFLKFINSNYSEELSFQEKLYWYYNDIEKKPTCKICGNKTKFINTREGYRTYCCKKCLNNDPNKQEKTKQTCLERYGGIAPAQNKNIIDKSKQTCLERYGVENAMRNSGIAEKSRNTNIERHGGCGNASEKNKIKFKQTCLKRYGVENAMQNKEVQENLKISLLEKYGVDHPSKLKSVKLKIQKSRRKIEMIKHPFIMDYTEDGDWICKCPHKDCDKCTEKRFIISPLLYAGRINDKTEICTNILPIGPAGNKDTYIEKFITNILDEYNIEYEANVKKIIYPQELDIYIPSKNLAIECNGIKWHNEYHKEKTYHINKTKLCNEKNIKLLHIWEDWIKNKPKIVKSIILNKLGINNDNNIYARKCVIKNIKSDICNNFLDKNHIQGGSVASVKLGLYYENELVSVMTFSPPRVNMGSKKHKQQWELVRFCSKLNTRVIGGASKLLKYFIKNYSPKSIVSFSMNDISNGHLYKTLGFESDEIINSSYWYVTPREYKRYHRMAFTKQAIVRKGWKDKIDNTWTEKEVMFEKGYYRIYDSGQLKWVLDLE